MMLDLGTKVLYRRLNKKRELLELKQSELLFTTDSLEIEEIEKEIAEIENNIMHLEIALDVLN